jgi:hypothetical protein
MTFFGVGHPSIEELASVARGNLEPSTGLLEQHLRRCPHCWALAKKIQEDVNRRRPPSMAALP